MAKDDPITSGLDELENDAIELAEQVLLLRELLEEGNFESVEGILTSTEKLATNVRTYVASISKKD